jgi:hypothetical protein
MHNHQNTSEFIYNQSTGLARSKQRYHCEDIHQEAPRKPLTTADKVFMCIGAACFFAMAAFAVSGA